MTSSSKPQLAKFNPAKLVGPAFVVAAFLTPTVMALFGYPSLGGLPEWLNARSSPIHAELFAFQYTLLTIGLSMAFVSLAFAAYRWSLSRRLLHLLLFCILLELFYRFAYGGRVTSGILLSVPETSGGETGELLGGHPFLTISLALVALLAIYALVVSWRTPLRIPSAICAAVGAISIAMICASLTVGKMQLRDSTSLRSVVLSEVQETFPVDIATAIGAVAKRLMDTSRLASTRAHFEFSKVHLVDASLRRDTPEIYVIVVGETSRRANWSIFGYWRSTTPRLDAIKSDLFLFNRVTSNATNTILSVPLVLTRATAAAREAARSEKSIITLLKQAGFETYWISNQARSDALFNPISQIAREADHVSFTTDMPASARGGGFDSNLLPRLNDVLARLQSKAKVVIFLHMEGSHFGYKERYPPSFAHFRSVPGTLGRLTDREARLVDEYDDSVYFTDYNVRGIIDRLGLCRCKAGLMFLSDHGERLFDNGATDSDFGHGFPTISRREIEVPFFIWVSSAYREANPMLVARLKANQHSAAELHSVFETVTDLAGVDYQSRNASLSLFSTDLRSLGKLQVLNTNEEAVSLSVPGDMAVQLHPQGPGSIPPVQAAWIPDGRGGS